MIMAAGIGTRLEPLTLAKPKPLMPVGNSPVMKYILQILKRHGISEAICNTHYLANQLTTFIKTEPVKGLNIEWIHEEELSGTAGGVKKCEDFLSQNETFIVMSSDSLTDINLEEIVKKHKEAGSIASMALKAIPKEEVVHMGVVVTNEFGRIKEFQEKPPIEEAKSNLVNTGIYIFEPEIFNYIPNNTFYDFAKQVFPALMKDNKPLYGFEINSYWNDIGTLKQYRLSSHDILEGHLDLEIEGKPFEYGWIGENTKLGDNITFEKKVMIGNNTRLEANVKFKQNVTIGHNCQIGSNTILEGCIIWNNVQIGDNCIIKNCIIGDNVIILDNTTINDDVIVPDNCQVHEGKSIPEGTKLKPNEVFV
jgi:mannose-1-phosphate guanylyltransferase/mannose-1-phosphate guanylyltransferase/phosphomannomutase